MERDGPFFREEISQMMHVAGEEAYKSYEITGLVEKIIKDQVRLILVEANSLAVRRGSRVFSNDDLIFQFRHDTIRVERMRRLIIWKAIRKANKASEDDKAGSDAVEECGSLDDLAGGSTEKMSTKESKTPNVHFTWEFPSLFPNGLPESLFEEDTPDELNEAIIERLRKNDDKTSDMTAEEYAAWTTFRRASFIYRKADRFREWSGLGVIAEHRPNDDSLDLLGFLACEMVKRLTEKALNIQAEEIAKTKRDLNVSAAAAAETMASQGPFLPSQESTRPIVPGQPGYSKPAIESRHIKLAFNIFQIPSKRSNILSSGPQSQLVKKLRLI
ncbi:transcription initiation factor IID, 18kD subunit-domain-containing protein [Dactylonectria macrodidyma]|uniref:Transcription initiation factor IID, 18kD subunit-domain-containing protein n=1 Tax=Dactylonectria macrodidyma TaxID=307937 RepID=A0A9P9DM48_9HYPO|nr:transcription initiation factor IID, 18kD subunit-domain-containing protein [Dactylonectria macrodidyma]